MSFLSSGEGGSGGGGDPQLCFMVDSYDYSGNGRNEWRERVPPPGNGVAAPRLPAVVEGTDGTGPVTHPRTKKALEVCPGRDDRDDKRGIRDGMTIPFRHPPSRDIRDMTESSGRYATGTYIRT